MNSKSILVRDFVQFTRDIYLFDPVISRNTKKNIMFVLGMDCGGVCDISHVIGKEVSNSVHVWIFLSCGVCDISHQIRK